MQTDKPYQDNYREKLNRDRRKVKGKGHQSRTYQKRIIAQASIESAGTATEDKARLLLAHMKADNLITRWKHTKRFSKADKEGADFLVEYKSVWVPVQVKSKISDAIKHQEFSRKPAWCPNSIEPEAYLLKRLRRYISHNLPIPLKLTYLDNQTKKETLMELRLCMDEAYYLCEIFRAQIAGKRYHVGPKQDVMAALERLRNEGIISLEPSKYADEEDGYTLSDAGFGFVRHLLTYCPEPKRYFVNQCNKYGPVNWKPIVEELYGYAATQKIPLKKKQVSVEHLLFQKTSWGWEQGGK